ncbi:PfkB family carbohydrate kinase [Skermania sp. ID1734]|uniref:PfkB family carbohydrate kinase n=1 Tax=Skermania sp. ID1734 TaxID=2597516 RepID=UPI001C8F64B9|nr:PfkB family carbohydrate kinase [Skermania sp. ID1734]
MQRPTGWFLGLATFDVIHLVDRQPGPNEKIRAIRQTVAAGGPATNAAVTFQHLGGAATLHTRLGATPLAGVIKEELTGLGVEIVDWSSGAGDEPPTSAISVLADSGDRAVTSTPGQLRDELLPESLPGATPDVVLVDGYYPNLVAGLLQKLDPKPLVVFDGGSYKSNFDSLMEFVDIAILSADFTAPNGDLYSYFAERGVDKVAVTSGAEPVQWRDGSLRGEIAVPAVAVKDTLGAGDVFHGAACLRLATGSDLADALAIGAQTAARSIGSFGTRQWLRET